MEFEPSTTATAPGGVRRPVLTIALALLLPFALAACGEADEKADQADPEKESDSAEEAAPNVDSDEMGEGADEEAGFPAPERDASGDLMPRVIMPDGPDTVLPDASGELASIPAEPAPAIAATSVTRVRALDKITARVVDLDLPQDEEVRFGTLSIHARTCRSRPPEEQPETFAYLEIDDVLTSDEHVRVFAGWMMASSPALNALEHPVYDVWVIACKRSSAAASSANE